MAGLEKDRRKEDLAGSQAAGTLEEVWLILWERWLPCESGPALGGGGADTGTSPSWARGRDSESHRMYATVGAMEQQHKVPL